MRLHGIVQTAELAENPPGGERVEMLLRLQGVGRGQPRLVVVPFEMLLADPALDPESVPGHGCEAEVEQNAEGRWIVAEIHVAGRSVLRPPDG